MNENSYFITGTDTNIGKTVISAILTKGLNAYYWKPIQTGACDATDSNFVGQWVEPNRVCPESYIFDPPLSPHLASQQQSITIDLNHCLKQFYTLPKPLVIEGAGGVLVPINSKDLMIDFIARLQVSVVIVASTRLGTINHTLLTLEALRSRQIKIHGVITVGEDNIHVQNSIHQFGDVNVLGHIPLCNSFSSHWFQKQFQQIAFQFGGSNERATL